MKWVRFSTKPVNQRFNKYKKDKIFNENVSGMATFESFDNTSAHMISARELETDIDKFDPSFRVARNCDFSICSMSMDCYGRVFETVRNAWADCQNGVLRILRERKDVDIYNLLERAEKYMARGFKPDEPTLYEINIVTKTIKEESLSSKLDFVRNNLPSFTSISFSSERASVAISKKIFKRLRIKEGVIEELSKFFDRDLGRNLRGKEAMVETEDKIIFHFINHGFSTPEKLHANRSAFEGAFFEIIFTIIDNYKR
jgi:hypothetical protein